MQCNPECSGFSIQPGQPEMAEKWLTRCLQENKKRQPWNKGGGGMSREYQCIYVGVSKNSGTTKSSILIGFSLINHPFWGTPIFGNTHIIYYI